MLKSLIFFLFCWKENKTPSKDEAQKFWVVSEEVDKTLLRQEVQDFCDQVPVFRMTEVDLRSAAVGLKGNVERRRFGKYCMKIKWSNLMLGS